MFAHCTQPTNCTPGDMTGGQRLPSHSAHQLHTRLLVWVAASVTVCTCTHRHDGTVAQLHTVAFGTESLTACVQLVVCSLVQLSIAESRLKQKLAIQRVAQVHREQESVTMIVVIDCYCYFYNSYCYCWYYYCLFDCYTEKASSGLPP